MLRVEAPGQHLSDFTPRPRPQAGALGAAGTEGAGGPGHRLPRLSIDGPGLRQGREPPCPANVQRLLAPPSRLSPRGAGEGQVPPSPPTAPAARAPRGGGRLGVRTGLGAAAPPHESPRGMEA